MLTEVVNAFNTEYDFYSYLPLRLFYPSEDGEEDTEGRTVNENGLAKQDREEDKENQERPVVDARGCDWRRGDANFFWSIDIESTKSLRRRSSKSSQKKFASPGSLIEDPKKLASLGPSKSSHPRHRAKLQTAKDVQTLFLSFCLCCLQAYLCFLLLHLVFSLAPTVCSTRPLPALYSLPLLFSLSMVRVRQSP
jgi:hypothetical protein